MILYYAGYPAPVEFCFSDDLDKVYGVFVDIFTPVGDLFTSISYLLVILTTKSDVGLVDVGFLIP